MPRMLLCALVLIGLLTACTPVTPAPLLLSATIVPTIAPTLTRTPSSTITPTMIPTQMVAGLTMIVREVEGGAPELDPIHFVTKQGESFDTLNMGKGDHFTFHWLDTVPMSLEVDSGKDKYVAQETYNNDGTKGQVILTRNGREIYRIDTGHGSPISALQGLWVYDNHWLLETNYYLDDMPFNGKITQDGILLNDTNDYEEAFGFQTINGLPFYFFKKKGLFDAWYDGEVISLGYEQIPHYSCCSSAELNPRARKNMVSFFGARGDTWYFVQLGVPDAS